eukprot:comp5429_c0_seq1/m.1399 comp5429_c0_seq1/g.1399  ORF comp5429_c0_seq1/g.1399 comp5429_c0_seq1/m.1399 type:complete len:286 (-) comp5429_c0_seq1:62-919(-)
MVHGPGGSVSKQGSGTGAGVGVVKPTKEPTNRVLPRLSDSGGSKQNRQSTGSRLQMEVGDSNEMKAEVLSKKSRRATSLTLPATIALEKRIDAAAAVAALRLDYSGSRRDSKRASSSSSGGGDREHHEGTVTQSPRTGRKTVIPESNLYAVAENTNDYAYDCELGARKIEQFLGADAADFWLYLKEQYLEENLLAWQTMSAFLRDPAATADNARDAIYNVYFGADTKWNVSVPMDVSLELDRVFRDQASTATHDDVMKALKWAQASLQPSLIEAYSRFRQAQSSG